MFGSASSNVLHFYFALPALGNLQTLLTTVVKLGITPHLPHVSFKNALLNAQTPSEVRKSHHLGLLLQLYHAS